MLSPLSLLALPLAVSSLAAALPASHEHRHASPRSLPNQWWQRDDHPVHALFARAPTDGYDYPEVGTPEWSQNFPSGAPDTSRLPQAWVDALNAAHDAGRIPDIPPSTSVGGASPTYPGGLDAGGPEVCSSTAKCRREDDIWDAPDGYFGTGFDDGPQPATDRLLEFLDQNNERATHFLIGVNMIGYPAQLQSILASDNDLAVHTWTHPYMTTQSNLQVVAQLGYTMELIRNSTGGRVPRYWRPPYGDSDNRVRAIALEVFHLEVIIWNQDTEDWSLTTGGTTAQAVNASLTGWLAGPKSPGLIVLEHELSNQSVQAFIDAYPAIKGNGWRMESVASLFGKSVFLNAESLDSDDVVPLAVGEDPSSTSEEEDAPEETGSGGGSSTSGGGSATTTTAGTSAAASSTQTGSDNAALGTAAVRSPWTTACGLLFGLSAAFTVL